MESNTRVPSGMPWMFFYNLRPGITAQDVQSFLAQCYLELPIENVAIKTERRTGKPFAMVAVPHHLVAMLCNWAINGQKLQDLRMDAVPS